MGCHCLLKILRPRLSPSASLIFLREGSGWRPSASNSLKFLKIISSLFHTPADSSTWLLSAPEIVNYEPLGLEADMW